MPLSQRQAHVGSRSPLDRQSNKQIRGVMLVELAIMGMCALMAVFFWRHQVSDTMQSCLATQSVTKVLTFFALSSIRPFIFTPLLFVAILGGKAFGPIGDRY